jgi:hypothetical protein
MTQLLRKFVDTSSVAFAKRGNINPILNELLSKVVRIHLAIRCDEAIELSVLATGADLGSGMIMN